MINRLRSASDYRALISMENPSCVRADSSEETHGAFSDRVPLSSFVNYSFAAGKKRRLRAAEQTERERGGGDALLIR